MKNKDIKKLELKQIIFRMITIPMVAYLFMCGIVYYYTRDIEQTKMVFMTVTPMIIIFELTNLPALISKKDPIDEIIKSSDLKTDKEIDVSTINNFYIIKANSRTAGVIYDNFFITDDKKNLIYIAREYNKKYIVTNLKGDYVGEIKRRSTLLTSIYTIKLNSGIEFSVNPFATEFYDYDINGIPYLSVSDTVYKNEIRNEDGILVAVVNSGIIEKGQEQTEEKFVKLGNSTVVLSDDRKNSEELIFLSLTINILKMKKNR